MAQVFAFYLLIEVFAGGLRVFQFVIPILGDAFVDVRARPASELDDHRLGASVVVNRLDDAGLDFLHSDFLHLDYPSFLQLHYNKHVATRKPFLEKNLFFFSKDLSFLLESQRNCSKSQNT